MPPRENFVLPVFCVFRLFRGSRVLGLCDLRVLCGLINPVRAPRLRVNFDGGSCLTN